MQPVLTYLKGDGDDPVLHPLIDRMFKGIFDQRLYDKPRDRILFEFFRAWTEIHFEIL